MLNEIINVDLLCMNHEIKYAKNIKYQSDKC